MQEFITTRQGYRLATSTGGVLTGRGADILIIDDILKPEEALSRAQRQSANEWFTTTRSPALTPSLTSISVPKVADFGDLVLTHHAVFYYEDVDALGIEHDRRVRHDQGRRLARDLKFDGRIRPWVQFTIGVGHVDLGQQGSRPGV